MPTRAMTHVNTLLTNMSIKYGNDDDNWIAHRAFPAIDVKKQSDVYAVFSKADFLRMSTQPRVPGKPSAVIDFSIDVSNSYRCDGWDAAGKLPDEDRANYDNPLEADEAQVRLLTEQMFIRREYQFVQTALATGVWTADHQGVASGVSGTQFVQFDASGAAFLATVRSRMNTFQTQSGGKKCNTIVMGEDVWTTIIDHSDCTGRIQYTERAIVTEEIVAALLEVDQVLVARSVYNTGPRGGTAAYSFLAPKYCLLMHVTKAPSIKEASAGYTFSWSPFDQAKGGKVAIDTYYDRPTRSTFYEGAQWFDHKVVAADLGLLMYDAVS